MNDSEKDSISAQVIDDDLVDFESFEREAKRRQSRNERELGINSFAGAASINPSKKKQPTNNPPQK